MTGTWLRSLPDSCFCWTTVWAPVVNGCPAAHCTLGFSLRVMVWTKLYSRLASPPPSPPTSMVVMSLRWVSSTTVPPVLPIGKLVELSSTWLMVISPCH